MLRDVRMNGLCRHAKPARRVKGSGLGRISALILFAAILYGVLTGRGAAEEFPPAFQPGEKLTFALRWGIIPAGEATLEVLPLETYNGQPVYHFVMEVKTNAFIDTFYRYRSRVDAYADQSMTRSIFYLNRTEARHSVKVTQVHFDWEKQEARYYRIKTKDGEAGRSSKRQRTTAILPGSFDPLSVFYYTRHLKFDENSPIERPVTDGQKCVLARATVLKREEVRINGQAYDTLLVQPDLKHVEGVFEKSDNAQILIWLTADEFRIPVKLKSKIIVGSFTGELVAVEGVQSQENALAIRTPRDSSSRLSTQVD